MLRFLDHPCHLATNRKLRRNIGKYDAQGPARGLAIITRSLDIKGTPLYRGDSSVLFAYLLLLLFSQIDNIYKVEQDSLYFFLEG